MNKMIKIWGTLCLMLLVQLVQAQTQNITVYPTDKFLENCLAHIEGQTNGGCSGCLRVAREKWEDDVEKKYEELMAVSNDREKQMAKSMHNSWLKYKEQHFKFLEEMYGEKTGTGQIILEEEKMKVVKHYALRIKGVLDTFSVCHLSNRAN
jgi:hypothetical protein